MKQEALTHTKMSRLMRRLKLRRYMAVGLCELLWATVAKETPRGDIGKLSDEDVAIALDWNKDPIDLIGGFIGAGFIERHEGFRLVIHDWYDHCQDGVHSKLARARLFFWDGRQPKLIGLRQDEKTAAILDYSALNALSTTMQPVAVQLTDHNLALPSLALPLPSQAITPRGDETFERIYAKHPRKGHRTAAEMNLAQSCAIGADLVEIERVHGLCVQFEWVNGQQKFAPFLDQWLIDKGWKYPPTAESPPPSNGKQSYEDRKKQEAMEIFERMHGK